MSELALATVCTKDDSFCTRDLGRCFGDHSGGVVTRGPILPAADPHCSPASPPAPRGLQTFPRSVQESRRSLQGCFGRCASADSICSLLRLSRHGQPFGHRHSIRMNTIRPIKIPFPGNYRPSTVCAVVLCVCNARLHVWSLYCTCESTISSEAS